MTDAGLLELLLSYAIPRRDVRPLAEALLAEFGSAAAVLAAEPGRLKAVSGIKETSAVLLKLVHRLATAGVGAPEQKVRPASPKKRQERGAPPAAEAGEAGKKPDRPTVQPVAPRVREAAPKALKRTEALKLQVSKGYPLDAAQNARLLAFIADHPEARRFTRRKLMEGTGLADGQIEGLTSISVAMGMIAPVTAMLTPFGRLIHRYDLFLDSPTSLEFCHFLGAGNPRNLIWHAIFNELLPNEKPTDQAGWCVWLREKLAGNYTKRTLVKHVASEVRFVVDAYTTRCLRKLDLLYEMPDQMLTLRRYTALQPLTLAAMVYWIGDQQQARLVSFADLQAEPGSPGRVFGLDASSMRPMVETLHQKGWIRYEVRHGLDQVRLIDGFEPLEFLTAAYEGRDPEARPMPDEPPAEQLLL